MKNLHVKFVITCFFLSLLACTSTEDSAKELAKKEVAKLLKDPESAKFDDVFTVQLTPPSEGDFLMGICGRVNGRNGFGAYAGSVRFASQIVVLKDKSMRIMHAEIDNKPSESNGTLSFDNLYWNNSCLKETSLAKGG